MKSANSSIVCAIQPIPVYVYLPNSLFRKELDAWVRNGSSYEMRNEAADRIRQCAEKGYSFLDLHGLWLKDLPDECLAHLTHLHEINLNKNELTSMPESIGRLTNLRTLDIGSNQLTHLPDSIRKCKELTLLNVRFNRDFTETPAELRERVPSSCKLLTVGTPGDPTLVDTQKSVKVMSAYKSLMTHHPNATKERETVGGDIQTIVNYLSGNIPDDRVELAAFTERLDALCEKTISIGKNENVDDDHRALTPAQPEPSITQLRSRVALSSQRSVPSVLSSAVAISESPRHSMHGEDKDLPPIPLEDGHGDRLSIHAFDSSHMESETTRKKGNIRWFKVLKRKFKNIAGEFNDFKDDLSARHKLRRTRETRPADQLRQQPLSVNALSGSLAGMPGAALNERTFLNSPAPANAAPNSVNINRSQQGANMGNRISTPVRLVRSPPSNPTPVDNVMRPLPVQHNLTRVPVARRVMPPALAPSRGTMNTNQSAGSTASSESQSTQIAPPRRHSTEADRFNLIEKRRRSSLVVDTRNGDAGTLIGTSQVLINSQPGDDTNRPAGNIAVEPIEAPLLASRSPSPSPDKAESHVDNQGHLHHRPQASIPDAVIDQEVERISLPVIVVAEEPRASLQVPSRPEPVVAALNRNSLPGAAVLPDSDAITQVPLTSTPEVVAPSSAARRLLFKNDVIDAERVFKSIQTTHQLKYIAGANSDCWWRSAWLSVLMQCDPKQLENRITDLVGKDDRDLPSAIRAMAEAAQKDVVNVVTHSREGGSDPWNTPSRLRTINEPVICDDKEGTQGEKILRELTYELMLRRGDTESVAVQSVIANSGGDAEQIFGLMRLLGADGVVFHQPHNKKMNQSPNHEKKWQFEVQPRDVSATDKPGNFSNEVISKSRAIATAKLAKQLANLPVLIIHSSHYDVYLPNPNSKLEPTTGLEPKPKRWHQLGDYMKSIVRQGITRHG